MVPFLSAFVALVLPFGLCKRRCGAEALRLFLRFLPRSRVSRRLEDRALVLEGRGKRSKAIPVVDRFSVAERLLRFQGRGHA